jgi:hypothetical protein
MDVRPAAVAGMFYPSDPALLRDEVQGYLDAVVAADGPPPKAIIVPHAGTIYSGPVAASAYARLRAASVSRVVLLGPAHRVFVRGVAAPTVSAFATPLGEVPLDRATLDALSALPCVSWNDEAHRREHSLELHLPFLQLLLGDFSLVPLVVGACAAHDVAAVLERAWGGDETLIVVSSDLSHFHDYATARRVDRETAALIASLSFERLDGERACGVYPVSGLLYAAKQRGMHVSTLDVRNSGDTAGSKERVVGYGAFAVD